MQINAAKRKMLKRINYFIATTALAVSACAPHTAIETAKPAIDIPAHYSGNYAQDIAHLEAEDIPEALQAPWWESFERPVLTSLVIEGLYNNQDVKQAHAILKQARAFAKRTGADRLPQIDSEGDIRKNWQDGNEQDTASNIGAALSWEIDIFDRVGSSLRADQYIAQARAEDIQALKLSLSAEIARTYFNIVAAHQSLQLLRQQSQLDQDLLDLLELRLKNGIGTNVDVLRQKARLADSEKLIPLAEADLAVFENRLDVLLGQIPDNEARVPADDSLHFDEGLPPVGVPAGLLLNRPDLRSMAARLFAADSDIAAAMADRFPQITLDASYAYSDVAAFSGPVALLAGAFVQPLLDWGKRKAEVERNEAVYEEKLAGFTQAFLEAVADVENTLISEDKQRSFLERLENQRRILQETADASQDRYKEGVDDYLPVIDALKELRQVERDEITEKLELVNIRINLFRALGGPLHQDISEHPND